MRRLTWCLCLFAAGCGNDKPPPAGGDPLIPGDPAPGDAGGDALPGDGGGDGLPLPQVDWAKLQHPASHTGAAGSTFTVYGRVFALGITDGAGQGGGITAEAGFGPAATPVQSWPWTGATYNTDVDSANDEYQALVTLPVDPGVYRFAFRFRLFSGPWTYADLDSTDNGFAMGDTGVLTVEAPPLAAIDWCRLQGPAMLQVAPLATTPAVYGQVYEAGITETGEASGIVAELGVGANGSTPDASWSWTTASFDSHQGNNDQYVATLVAPDALDTRFDYAFRFRLAAGADWLYCDLDGSAVAGYATEQAGDLLVANRSIDWARLQYPESHTGPAGSDFTVYGRVLVTGVTDSPGQGSGVTAEAGVGLATEGVEDWSWTSAGFNLDAGPNNDEYVATVPLPATPAVYRFAYRFRLLAGAWSYADLDSTDDGFDVGDAGILTVEAVPPPAVDWCRLEEPPTIQIGPGETSPVVTGRVYEAGLTETADPAGLEAELGVGPNESEPAEPGWTWGQATFDSHQGNNDQYRATLVAPDAPGAFFDYAFRFRLTAGGDWLYCDLDGSAIGGYSDAQAGSLLVEANPVDWAKLETPPDAAKVLPGAPVRGRVRVYDDPLTRSAGPGAGLEVEVGVGADGSDPTAGGWSFSGASYYGDATGEGGTPLADDMFAWLGAAPATPGTYDLAARARVGVGPWLYADTSGSDAGDPYASASALSLTVLEMPAGAAVTWCRLQGLEGASPVTAEVSVGPGVTVGLAYGQVYAEANATAITGPAGTGPTPRGQLGYGDDGTDPASHASWVWGNPGAFNRHPAASSNDEQMAALVAPATPGVYDWTWRFSADGSTWLYCDADGAQNGYAAAQAGALRVE